MKCNAIRYTISVHILLGFGIFADPLFDSNENENHRNRFQRKMSIPKEKQVENLKKLNTHDFVDL